jgi:hypothetical protein
VRSPKGRNNVTKLPHGTSLFELEAPLPDLSDMAQKAEWVRGRSRIALRSGLLG